MDSGESQPYLSPQIVSFSPVMSSLLDRIPYVPKLTNFLGCLDLQQGVRYASIFLTVLWIVYAIVSFFYLALGNI